MRVAAVLPVKTFGRAKQRLGARLGEDERRMLAEAMVGDVLAALREVDAITSVVVVTAEPAAAEAALAAGAAVVHDPEEHGQSAAAARGIAALPAGTERVLLVPGDCPALAPGEVAGLLAGAGDGPGVVIVPDRHGTGTNALVITPPQAIAPSFGPGSFARHAALARAAGARVAVAELPSLGLDVDTPDDLDALRAALATRSEGAARTRAVLERLRPAGQPATA
jgi:2-phospho-L-lactate/phosphoenolpyruvate guanylyltransferase